MPRRLLLRSLTLLLMAGYLLGTPDTTWATDETSCGVCAPPQLLCGGGTSGQNSGCVQICGAGSTTKGNCALGARGCAAFDDGWDCNTIV
jgi:hypothetical protein